MKEIGETLREAREQIGVSIDEVAEDLNVSPEQITNVETANMKAFPNIFDLKVFISEYAKYLGLSKDDMIDEFNEYLFDYTSKLSLEEIQKETKIEKAEANKIKSPYTIEHKNEQIWQIASYAAIVVLFIIICYLLYTIISDKNSEIDDSLCGGVYELTQ